MCLTAGVMFGAGPEDNGIHVVLAPLNSDCDGRGADNDFQRPQEDCMILLFPNSFYAYCAPRGIQL